MSVITIGVSALVAGITTKIIATYYFKKVDGYVKEMCEMTAKSNEDALAILHKLQRNSLPKEQRRKANSCQTRMRQHRGGRWSEMEIRSIKIDFDKDILEINGKKAEKPVIVTLPGPDGWPIQKMFNPEIKPYEEYGRITVTINNKL